MKRHFLAAAWALAVSGTVALAQDKVIEVAVIKPIERMVTDHEISTGRIEASARVEIRSQASGILQKVLVENGDAVKKGQLLFEIDGRAYKVLVELALAELARSEAAYKLATATRERFEKLRKATPASVSRQELDMAVSQQDDALAGLTISRIKLESAKLQLEHTRITSPVDGRVAAVKLDVGNLVSVEKTLLATIEVVQSMTVHFEIRESTALNLRRKVMAGKIKAGEFKIEIGLADEEFFPHKATVDVADTRVDAKTNKMLMKATLPNADGLLVAGLNVRTRLAVGEPYKALVIPAAVAQPNGLVWVVNGKKVINKYVRFGGARYDKLITILDGIAANDLVIIDDRQVPAGEFRLRIVPIDESTLK